MSPEQAWGKKIDRRTDIFSLGIVLFEMLTGERLFTGDTDLTILEQVRDARVVAPSTKNPDVPKKVDQIVLKALAKNPQDRYQNASELEKDINQVLYSYQPTPGPADLAIYMHRLLDASPAASDAQIDAAFAKAEQQPAHVEPQKKGKGLVIAKKAPAVDKTDRAPEPAPAAPVEVSQPAISMGREPAKSRTGLYAGIGVAAIALIAAAIFVTKKKPEPAPAPVPAPEPPAATAASTSAPPAPAPTTAASSPSSQPSKIIDPKAVEAEVKRLAALKEKELAKSAAAGKQPAAPPTQAPAAVSLAPKQPLQPPKPNEQPAPQPTAVVQAPPPAPPTKVVVAEKPTEVPPPPAPKQEPVKVAEARPVEARPADVPPNAPVREGDLVGPGEGVVEPRIVRMGAFTNLPPQVKQMSRGSGGLGTLMISALITENGAVSDTRIVKASPYKAVDDAAVNALKGSKIEPATKNGVRVKMWKTFAITVKP
jgi:serine/threonine-protein kinase